MPVPSKESRIRILDRAMAERVGNDIIIGEAFAFLAMAAMERPALRWVSRLLGSRPQPQLVSLLGPEPIELAGVSIAPLGLPRLRLTSITSDKPLYRQGRDSIELLALDLDAPKARKVLVINLNGSEYARRPLRLDQHGAATVTLRDLPTGEVQIRFAGAPEDEEGCRFTVAAYRLAPLVASLVQRNLAGQSLHIELRVESYGVLLDGPVVIELMDGSRRASRIQAAASEGVVKAELVLQGAGPFSLNVISALDPSCTATVPLIGSRAAERERTLLSMLGAEIGGSMLPAEGARPVRGIHLDEGGQRSSPLSLERVDTMVAKLTARVAIERLTVALIDPTSPRPRDSAKHMDKAPHPAHEDAAYREGEALFKQQRWQDACAVFERARAALSAPHPNYAYYIACCFARAGDSTAALNALVEAVRDGWWSFSHMAADEDLASLHGLLAFEALLNGGIEEIRVDGIEPGQVIELPVAAPLRVLALGAFIKGKPWEGWAVTLAPNAHAAKLELSEATPGEDLTITIETGDERESMAYLIVKDARLLSADTPQSRLAAQLKQSAQRAGERLRVGAPAETLLSLLPMPLPPPPPGPPRMPAPGGMAYGVTAWDGAVPAGRPSPPAMIGTPFPSAGAVPGAPRPVPAPPPPAAPAPAAPAPAAPPIPRAAGAPAPHGSPTPEGASTAAPEDAGSQSAVVTQREPEVLFAGTVALRQGRGQLSIILPDAFADYVVEAFLASGHDWQHLDKRFSATKETFVALSAPPFVHRLDSARGQLTASCASGHMRVVVRRDDEIVLEHEHQMRRVELTLPISSGHYRAMVEDLGDGSRDQAQQRVGEPGKLRHIGQALRLLQPGESIDREAEPAIVGLRVLPGLKQPFRALVDATADFTHACCEQTAAKIISAVVMWLFAADDAKRRRRAESIITAGIRREETMWIRGSGFKMYPHTNGVNSYWSPLTTRHLYRLASLQDSGMSGVVREAIDRAMQMAVDTAHPQGVVWPPRRPTSLEDAYALAVNGQAEAALALARTHVADRASLRAIGGAVARRTQMAYGAATLLRAGQSNDLAAAIALTNQVVADLGEEGRLYSTVDSVAAIALMSELRRANIVGGGGRVSINGELLSAEQATQYAGEIRHIEAHDGVVAVQVSTMAEQSWEAFDSGLSVMVALQKDGRPGRRFQRGDALDLVVKLDEGYKAGDIAWICLPDSLTRVIGGGQVKLFSVDFEGADEVRIPLVATAATSDSQGTEAMQRYAACVRNMFEEERAAGLGLLEVTITR